MLANKLMGRETYELSLSPNYVQGWGVVEACRELFQNGLDSSAPFEYIWDKDSDGTYTLSVISRDIQLCPSTLLLGTTSKEDDDDAIGQFGEGYKIALLVLVRDGFDVRVLNGEYIWTPEFAFSKKYRTEMFQIHSERNPQPIDSLVFEIRGITESQRQKVILSNLHMQDEFSVITTSYGRILHDHPAKLFVNGLYVCEIDGKYGYDVKPEYLKLERDRNTVSNWDLKYNIAQMWLDSAEYDKIAEEMEEGVSDFSHMEYYADSLLKEACFSVFKKKHPKGIPVKSQDEMEAMVKEGFTNTVYVGSGAYGHAVTSASSYQAVERPAEKTVAELLSDYFKENKKYMKRQAIIATKDLIKQSQEWRFK